MRQLTCDALLFDLDGVLIDSKSCITRHWEAWAGKHGLDLSAVMQAAHGIRAVETMRLVAPHLDVQKEAERFTAGEIADTDGVVVDRLSALRIVINDGAGHGLTIRLG